MKNLSALILAKGQSRRLPNKNTLDFHGIPMFLVNVEKCLKIFDKVYVSSDDEDILDWADSRGAIAIKRPEELCGNTPNIPVYQHAMQYMGDIDGLVAVQANSPNVSPNMIKRVKEAMEDWEEVITIHNNSKIYGSVWGLSTDKLYSYRETYDYFNPTPQYRIQDLSVDIHTLKDYQQALRR